MTAERVSVLVKFPPELLERVEARGSEHGISRMAAIVALIERGLEASGPSSGALTVIPVGGGRKIPVERAARETTPQGMGIVLAPERTADQGQAVSNFTPNGAGVSMGGAMAAAGVQFGPSARAPRPKGGAAKKSKLMAMLKGEKS